MGLTKGNVELDHDGSALPAGLADYGYTGRVARVVSANTLA